MPRGRTVPADILRRPICPFPGCNVRPRSSRALTYHVRSIHRDGTLIQPSADPRASSPEPDNDGRDFGESPEPPSPPGGPSSLAPSPSPDADTRAGPQRLRHPFLTGRPCDENGQYLPEGTPPPERNPASPDDWSPYQDEVQFELADLAFRKQQSSRKHITELLRIWALDKQKTGDLGPFASVQEMHDTIDATHLGDAPWKCLTMDPLTEAADAPLWARQTYDVWYRDPETVATNMLDNPTFDGAFDTMPYVHLDANGKRRWHDFMSANFAYRHATDIYQADATTEGSMYTPLFFGADKTTVSVGTGNVEYHPVYLSLGNFHSSMRRAHRDAILPFAFLAIPKSDRTDDNDPNFRLFKKQLYHASLAKVLATLKPGMTTPVVRRCPDGHFRRVIYDFGPFITDYPEQVTLAGIVQNWCCKCAICLHQICTAPSTELDGDIGVRRTQERTNELIDLYGDDRKILWDSYGINADIIPFTHDFPRADIHEMISPDLLHQMIKGTFKDHLVTWVGEYLDVAHPPATANAIMDQIDRRQWTGDDSKALMKVYLPAIKGLVPDSIVSALAKFLDFCYLVRRSDFDEDSFAVIDETVRQFHHHREAFRELGVRETFSLPRQHSMKHYADEIREFGAPNGVCSSMTESRHITAVKEPWRRSNRFEALGQMLLTNQRLDKLAVSRADFVERGLLVSEVNALPDNRPSEEEQDEEISDGLRVDANVVLARTRGMCIPVLISLLANKASDRSYPKKIDELAAHVGWPQLPELVEAFLKDQIYSGQPVEAFEDDDDIDLNSLKIHVFHSAVASFYAPSDISGIRGMRREWIRSTPSWRKTGARRDCAYVVENQETPGFRGMSVVRVQLLFSFDFDAVTYPCALVEWFKKVGRSPDSETGMWIVEPEMEGQRRLVTVVHLDSFLRGAHLIPVFGEAHLPIDFKHTYSLDVFNAYHVNKYADHHANEIAF
ncbi:hypothetical protein C8F01DRAFT_1206314 [Mycena amicta]|nr:hypothetical protein C8F01DRAFT_1206314 [Mycena amicta]